MMILIFACLSLVHQISSLEIDGEHFKSIKAIQANLNIKKVVNASSVVQCATHCSNDEGCTRANYYDSTCEMLDFEPDGGEIELVEEHNSKYICKFESLLLICSREKTLYLFSVTKYIKLLYVFIYVFSC